MITKLAYRLKQKLPTFYSYVEQATATLFAIAKGRLLSHVRAKSNYVGNVDCEVLTVRILEDTDSDVIALSTFLNELPNDHLRFFHPHGFSPTDVRRVLRRLDRICSGLFQDELLVAYTIIKLYPGNRAFLGLVVHPRYVGRGIGKFLWRFMYWQCSILRVEPFSTISRHNDASLRSQRAVASCAIVEDLDNDYQLVRGTIASSHRSRPRLKITHQE